MLHNPAALYLACHFLFKVFALTVTVICLQCLQILYKSPQSGNTKISEFFWEKQCRKITFVLLLLKHIVRFCCFHPLMCPTFIFRNAVHSGYSSSEQCCVSLSVTCPIVQHQVVLQRRFDVSGLLWAECKYAHRHGPGDCTGWQLARHLHTKFCLCTSGEKKFGVLFHLSD